MAIRIEAHEGQAAGLLNRGTSDPGHRDGKGLKSDLRERLALHAVPFLARLLGCSSDDAWNTPVTFQTFDDVKPDGVCRQGLARVLHGSLEELAEKLARLNSDGAGIFITVNGTDGLGRRKANIQTLRAWWCDVDTKGAGEALNLDRLPLSPSMVVRTPGGCHLYWIAEAPMLCTNDARRSEHEDEVKAIAQALAPFGGDLRACDVVRVLRVPGFFHSKGEPLLVTRESVEGPKYAQPQIQAAFPSPAPKMGTTAAPKQPEGLAPTQRAEILRRAAAYLEKIPGSIAGKGGNAEGGTKTFNDALKFLSRFDVSEDEALALMQEHYNPRCEPSWSDEDLRHKIQGASAHLKGLAQNQDGSRNPKALQNAGARPPKGIEKNDLAPIQASISPSEASERPTVPGFEWRAHGLFKVTVKPGKDGEEAKEASEWIAPMFALPGLVRDEGSQGWRLLIAWRDLDGVEHEEAVPFEMLSGEGLELGRTLGQGGLLLPPEVGARKHVLRYLCRAHHKIRNRIRIVEALGWHGGAFVLPTGQVLGQAEEVLRYAGDVPGHRASATGGTLDGWRAGVAGYAVGNPRLAFALASAFAGPLLALVRPDGGGGFNLQGFSSKGKSTCLEAAASVWGRPDPLPTWRATANGLEGIAAARNDGFLVLDELSQVDAKEAGQVAYMLANGSAKARATREGGSRPMKQWRLIFLSSGEQGLEDKLSEDGKKVRAGQEVRVPDIPCPPSGMLDNAHGFPDLGALAEHLKAEARKHYGHASRAFLIFMCEEWERREALRTTLRDMEAAWLAEQVPVGADPQVRRVAGRFALVAVAGELAQRMGVLPWPKGESSMAAAVCFHGWLDRRGHAGASEVQRGIAAVLAFLDKHGMSRFDEWGDREARPILRAGTRKRAEGPVDSWDFFLTPEAWKEACQGFGPRDVARSCVDAGILELDGAGKHSRSIQIPGHGKARCYIIRAASVARYMEREDG